MTTNEKVFIIANFATLTTQEQEHLLSIALNNEPNYKHSKNIQETNNGTAINLDKCSTSTINLLYKYIYSIVNVNVPNNTLITS
jgi:hypothetical protein